MFYLNSSSQFIINIPNSSPIYIDDVEVLVFRCEKLIDDNKEFSVFCRSYDNSLICVYDNGSSKSNLFCVYELCYMEIVTNFYSTPRGAAGKLRSLGTLKNLFEWEMYGWEILKVNTSSTIRNDNLLKVYFRPTEKTINRMQDLCS